jgi:hypothetical protein
MTVCAVAMSSQKPGSPLWRSRFSISRWSPAKSKTHPESIDAFARLEEALDVLFQHGSILSSVVGGAITAPSLPALLAGR